MMFNVKGSVKTSVIALLLLGLISVPCTALAYTQAPNLLSAPVSDYQYSLNELLSAVIKNNPAMHGKQAEVEVKKHLTDGARAARYPSASLNAGYANSNFNDTNSNDATLYLQVKQPLWAFGKIDNSIAYADKDVRASEADLMRISRELLNQTVVAYTALESVKRRQDILAGNVAALEQLHQQIKRRHAGKIASKSDVDLAFLRLIQARSQKNKIDGDVLLAVNELSALTQLPVQHIRRSTPDLITLPDNDNEVMAMAVRYSADVAHKVSLLDLAKANTTKEKTSIMPVVYLQGSKQLNELSSNNGQQIGITIEVALDGLGFSQAAMSKAAHAKEYSSRKGVEVARTELSRQVTSLLHARRTQGEMTQVIEQSIGSFESILASYIRQYEAGKKNWLDVLNIQREMTTTQLELVDVGTQWYSASLKLMVLVGQLDIVKQREQQ